MKKSRTGLRFMWVLAALLVASSAIAQTVAVPERVAWKLYKGSALVKPVKEHASLPACAEAARVLGVAASYSCRAIVPLVVKAAPPVTPPAPPAPSPAASAPPVGPPPAASAPVPAPDETWTRVAFEGKAFTLVKPTTVRYGVAGKYSVRVLAIGTHECSNSLFGDPAYQVFKACEASSVAPTPAPAPPTPPASAPAALPAAPAAALISSLYPVPHAPRNVLPPPGSVVVEWTRPNLNVNGSVLTDLAGYVIRYGSEPGAGATANTVRVDDPLATRHVIGGLPRGTYYLSVVAFGADGRESAASPEIGAVVP